MKSTIKLAVLGAGALAASSTAALAASELPSGALTGLALGAPLPQGFYDLSIASYGSSYGGHPGTSISSAYAAPVWLYWSTPWEVAGGRVSASTMTSIADRWVGGGPGLDSFLNTLVEGGISWNLHNGFNVGLHAGAWLPSTQALPTMAGRDYTAFQGIGVVSYVAHGWDLTALTGYGSGGGGTRGLDNHWQPESVSLDLTAAKKYGNFETGSIAYGSWDKEQHFALGGLVGYDFGSFVAQAKLGTDVAHSINGVDVAKETRGWLMIVKPLWTPEDESLK
jgi:hypothetical protein